MKKPKPSAFKKMTYDVYNVPKRQKLISVYPELKELFKGLLGNVMDDDTVIRYICFCYDINSPLQEIKNIHQRKVEAAKMAGFATDENGSFLTICQEIMNNQDPYARRMIMRFVKFTNNLDYSHYVFTQEIYYNSLAMATEMSEDSADAKKRGVTWDKTASMLQQIKEGFTKVFSGDSNIIHYVASFQEEEEEEILIFPEQYARTTEIPRLPGR